MSFRQAYALCGLPGLVLAVAALAGWVPTARDTPGYFVPLRLRTAQVLRGEHSPWINLDVGCGEPFFANPQSALLYPLAWWALALPPEKAVGVEVGLHLGILALGVARLVRRLGGTPGGALAAAWGAALSGPTLSAAGMLNNLETAAWLPWVWEAALSGHTVAVALTTAASFFAAEPALALVGSLGAVLLAPHPRVWAGVALGYGLAAVQAIPMAFWVTSGDRGLQKPLEAVSLGGVSVGELPALAVPGFPLPAVDIRFLPVITVPLWMLLALTTLKGSQPSRRRLTWLSAFCLFLAVLPTLPWGDALWVGLSSGLVRLPGRFLIPAALALAAVAGSSKFPRNRWWPVAALALGVAGALASHEPWAVLLQAATAAAVPWGAGWALAGALFLAASTVPVLELARSKPQEVFCAQAQRPGRLYPLPVDGGQIRWVRERGPQGEASMAWGYTVLLDGRQLARTFGPLTNGVLAQHLGEADRGATHAWWVSALGAQRLLALHPLSGLRTVCHEAGLWVAHNPTAFPLWAVLRRLPQPGEGLEEVGEVVLLGKDRHRWRLRVRTLEGGVFLWLFAPDRGWRFAVDAQPAAVVRGVGILQGVTVPPGEHEVEVSYRPPGLSWGLSVTLLSLILVGVLWRQS